MKLFEEVSIGNVTAKNRIAVAPMVVNYSSEDGSVTEKDINYFKRLAQGGVGTIITGSMNVTPKEKISDLQTGIYHDKFIEQQQKLVDGIKKYDVKLFSQLAHGGPKISAGECVSASEVLIKEDLKPRKLEKEEIYDIIQKFIDAAKRVKEAGYDGVELHGAHFYLLSAFLSPYTNRRNDEFGGDIYRNTKIVREIIQRIKSEIGKDFPIITRINAVEKLEKGIKLGDGIEIAKQIERAGGDAIHVSSYTQPVSPSYSGLCIPVAGLTGWEDPPLTNVEFSEKIKNQIDIPVLVADKIYEPASSREVVRQNKADVIALGRQMLADPDWPNKVKDQEVNKINTCIHCNVCHEYQQKGKGVRCAINEEWEDL